MSTAFLSAFWVQCTQSTLRKAIDSVYYQYHGTRRVKVLSSLTTVLSAQCSHQHSPVYVVPQTCVEGVLVRQKPGLWWQHLASIAG